MKHYLSKHKAVCKVGATIDGRQVTLADLQGMVEHYNIDWLLGMLTYAHDDQAEIESRDNLSGDNYYGRTMALSLDGDVMYADIAFTDAAAELIKSGKVRDFSCGYSRVVLNQNPDTGDWTVGQYLHHIAMVPTLDRPAMPGLDRPEDMLKDATEIELSELDLNLLTERLTEARYQEGSMKETKTRLQSDASDGAPDVSALVKSAQAAMPTILAALGDAVKAEPPDAAAIKAAMDELKKALSILGIEETAAAPEAVVTDEETAALCNDGDKQYAERIASLEAEIEAGKVRELLAAEKEFMSPAEIKYLTDEYSAKRLNLQGVEQAIKLVHIGNPQPRFDGSQRFTASQITGGDIKTELSKLSTSAGWTAASDATIVEWLRRQGQVAQGTEPSQQLIEDTRRCWSERLLREETDKILNGGGK